MCFLYLGFQYQYFVIAIFITGILAYRLLFYENSFL